MRMKTSDKILLYSTISAVGFFLSLDLIHFVKYRRGEVLNFSDIERLDYVSREDTGVRWLVLDGPMRTLMYPAGSSGLAGFGGSTAAGPAEGGPRAPGGSADAAVGRLKIDVEKSRVADLTFTRHGDTLEVVMNPTDTRIRSAHDDWYSYGGYLPVRIFFPSGLGIRVRNGFTVLNNEERHKGVSASLELDSTQCWLGSYSREFDTMSYTEPWDSVRVRGINSNFIVNRQIHVHALDLRLDTKSQFSDRYSLIDTAYVEGDTNTLFILRGRNFGRIHTEHVVHSAP